MLYPAMSILYGTSQPKITARPQSKIKRAKAAPITREERKSRTEHTQEKQALIDADILDWYNATVQEASRLAEKHDKKERFFLDLLFNAGRVQDQHSVTSAFSAWGSIKMAAVNKGELTQ